MADLRTDYKDDVLDTSVNTQRKYQMMTNEDGTVSFADVTEYTQVGDTFGATDVNAMNNNILDNSNAITKVNNELTTKVNTNTTNVSNLTTKVNTNTTNISKLTTSVNSCFQSVSNGKALVASAITGKGVSTASDATFETMANNVSAIPVGKFIYLGTGTSFNVKTICANNGIDYTKLTLNNFIVGFSQVNAVGSTDYLFNGYGEGHYYWLWYNAIAPSKSYNASTGVLSIGNCTWNIGWRDFNYSNSVRFNTPASATAFAYLVYTA